MSSPINIEQFLVNLKIHLLRNNPFYGHVLQQLPVCVSDAAGPTLAVGKLNRDEMMIRLFVNPSYVEHVVEKTGRNELKVRNHFVEVLRHEVHHLVFQHLTYDLPDKTRLDIACELSDNSYINRSMLVDKAIFPEDFKLESGLGVNEYYILLKDNPKYNEMIHSSSEEYAESEEEKAMEEQSGISSDTGEMMSGMGSGKGKPSEGGFGEDARREARERLAEARELQDQAMDDLSKGDAAGAGYRQHQAAQKIRDAKDALGKDRRSRQSGDGGNGTLDSHDQWNNVRGDDLTNEMVKDIIRQANETCRLVNNWGDLPGSVREAIDQSYESSREIIPWEVILKNFLASASENVLDYTMKRKSKRYDTRPGTKKDDVLSVAIGIDTSGSVDNEMLKMFFGELKWMEKSVARMTVFEWDTKVQREYDFSEYDGTVAGRGGTDPNGFLERVSERKFDCVIIFTDMFFEPIKKTYGIPMMWVVDRGGMAGGCDADLPLICEEGIILKVNDSRDGFYAVRR